MKTLKTILLVILLTALPCFAANIYVDPTNGVDATGDGTIGAPEKTISAAVTTASTGDTIKLIAGTYNDDSQIWSVSMTADNLTIEPNTPGTRIMLTRTAEGSYGWFRVMDDRTGYTYTFNNIDFVDAKSGSIILFWYLEVGGNVVFNNCTFSVATSGTVVAGTEPITDPNTMSRKLVMNNCNTLLASGTAFIVISLNSFSQVTINDCNFTNNTTTSTKEIIRMTDMLGPHIIKDCNIIGENPIKAQNFTTQNATLLIEGNTLKTTQDTNGRGITVGNEAPASPITIHASQINNNKIKGYYFGILNYSNDTEMRGNTIYCVNPIASYGGVSPSIVNNTLIARTDGSDFGRCLVLGRHWYAKQGTSVDFAKDYTDFGPTTVSVTAGGGECDFNNVLTDGSMLAFVTNETSGSPMAVYYGRVVGTAEDTNTITVDQWIKVADNSIETPADNTYYVSVVRYTEEAYVVNNIIDGGRAGYTVTFDFNPVSGNNYFNYNCYVPGWYCLSNLGSVKQTSLSMLIQKWQTWPYPYTESYYNDANSIQADPRFADVANDDFHLKSNAGRWDPNQSAWVSDAITSLCIDAGDPNSDWTAEPWPNGGRINMGNYGGTPEASMSLSSVGNKFDMNNDGYVNYTDLEMFFDAWLSINAPLKQDFNLDGLVDLKDYTIFAENWFWQE